MSNEQTLIIGRTYLVNSQRKGTFMMRLVSQDDTWATGEIVAGKASPYQIFFGNFHKARYPG